MPIQKTRPLEIICNDSVHSACTGIFFSVKMSSYEVVDLTSDVEAPSPSRAVVIDNVVASPLPVRAAPLQPEPRVSLVKPWWHRLPHFVPVAVIEYGENGTGIDPR